jgi:hypothetical protein
MASLSEIKRVQKWRVSVTNATLASQIQVRTLRIAERTRAGLVILR